MKEEGERWACVWCENDLEGGRPGFCVRREGESGGRRGVCVRVCACRGDGYSDNKQERI